MIIKRYLVLAPISDACISEQKRLEEEFLEKISALKPGIDDITVSNYAEKNFEIINEHNEKVQKTYENFVKERGIAEGLSSQVTTAPTFDNFFQWDIVFSVHGSRLFMEVRAVNEAKFPIKGIPAFLRELDEKKFLFLSGRTDM